MRGFSIEENPKLKARSIKSDVYTPILRVNQMPFKTSLKYDKEESIPTNHTSRKENPKRREVSPISNKIYTVNLEEGLKTKYTIVKEDTNILHIKRIHRKIQKTNSELLIPFAKNDEPVLIIQGSHGPVTVFTDTGAMADLIPKQMLYKTFPEWKDKHRPNKTKLIAANDTKITHLGKTELTLELPNGNITVEPFITNQDDEENVMILGYPTMMKYGIIPIPGVGILTHQNLISIDNSSTTMLKLMNAISKHPIGKISRYTNRNQFRKLQEKPHEKFGTIAHPMEDYFMSAYKRKSIKLKLKNLDPNIINEKNGETLLVRECPCIYETGNECDQCKTEPNKVQMCKLFNGLIDYIQDNTSSGISFSITTNSIYYVDFQQLFKMDELAQQALEDLGKHKFEVDLPENQYTDKECQDLFQKTKNQVSLDLRSIIAEPGMWSIEGYRPPTLKLVDINGQEKGPNRNHGPVIPIEEFENLNPCHPCRMKGGKYFCNMELEDCKMRIHYRHKTLPAKIFSTIKEETKEISMKDIESNMEWNRMEWNGMKWKGSGQNKHNTMIIGCHRNINNHKRTWERLYKECKTMQSVNFVLHELGSAVITESSKLALLGAYEKAKANNCTNIYFTNFAAYGISKNLLQKCFPDKNMILRIYRSKDIKVAGPGFDPRKSKQNIEKKKKEMANHTVLKEESIIMLEAGNNKNTNTQKSKVKDGEEANILTENEGLREKCKEMLDSHSGVFAQSEADCGQFVDPKTRKPYLFNIRLIEDKAINQKCRFVTPAKEQAAESLICALLENKVIRRQWSYNNSQSVYVPKKRPLLSRSQFMERGGKSADFEPGMMDETAQLQLRHCVDYSELNKLIQECPAATLSPKQLISRLHGQTSTCVLDISGAYHGLTLDKESRLLTGFDSGLPNIGRLTYDRAPMGLACSSGWLQAALNHTLAAAYNMYLLYCDDLIIIGQNDEELMQRLSIVLQLLSSHGWRIKRHKLAVFCKKLTLFGMNVNLNEQTITAPRAALDAVLTRPRPASKDEMKQFLGSVAWHGSFLTGHAPFTATLQRMARKDNTYEWNENTMEAYEKLVELYAKPDQFNCLPNYELPFHIIVDSSEFAAGFLLAQITPEQKLRIIGYHSHLYDERMARQPPFERESAAALFALHGFMDIVAGRKTILHTDSRASVYIGAQSKGNSKVARWNTLLHSFAWLQICWISNKTNILSLADYLSRQAAGSKEWKNKSLDMDTAKLIEIASSKLKRDIAITMRHHNFIIDYVCKLTEEELNSIEKESIYVDQEGKICFTNTMGQDTSITQVNSNGENLTLKMPSETTEQGTSHPAFHNKKKIYPESEKIEKQDESNDEHHDWPQGALDKSTEDELVRRIAKINVQAEETVKPANEFNCNPEETGRQNQRKNSESTYTTLDDQSIKKDNIYNARFKDHKENTRIQPAHILTYDEAEDMDLLAPATQVIDGQSSERIHSDIPLPDNKEDAASRFLNICFEKSPHMRVSTLIEQQKLDPIWETIREQCKTGPVNRDGAIYMLKNEVLIREETKQEIKHYKICIPKAAAYNLALKMHSGTLRKGWNIHHGTPPHNGPRKLHSLISQRFYARNLSKLCKHICDSCYICAEDKDNHVKTREDAKQTNVKVTTPAAAWAIDLLSLPTGCLLVCACLFSRFIIAIPVEGEATSENLWNLFNWHILGVHGRCRFVIADNAKNISGTAIKQLCAQLGIILRNTPIYSPRSNYCELANRHLLQALRLYHHTYNIPYNRWRITIPSVLAALNHTPFAGELGQKYHLSPAGLFYTNRDTLDPGLAHDYPYIKHVYKDYHAFVQHSSDVAWITQQLVTNQRQREKEIREKNWETKNKNFKSQKTFRTGDVILLERHHIPGVYSKLRPRGQMRFVVVDQTDTCVYARPWSKQSIDNWAKATDYSKKNKENIIRLPVITLPKERVKLDKSLHLWTSQTQSPEKILMDRSIQEDPKIVSIDILTQNEDDWLDTVAEEEVHELEPEEEDKEEQITPNIWKITVKNNGCIKKQTIKRKITFNNTVQFSNGTIGQIKNEPLNRIKRTILFDKDKYTEEDKKYMGAFKKTVNGTLIYTEPKFVYNRKCGCSQCTKQVSNCNHQPCKQCTPI